MDLEHCLEVLSARASLLLTYYARTEGDRPDKSGLFLELRWLAADARRWGVPLEDVEARVLDNLMRGEYADIAARLYREFLAAFTTAHLDGPPREGGPSRSARFRKRWRTASSALPV